MKTYKNRNGESMTIHNSLEDATSALIQRALKDGYLRHFRDKMVINIPYSPRLCEEDCVRLDQVDLYIYEGGDDSWSAKYFAAYPWKDRSGGIQV